MSTLILFLIITLAVLKLGGVLAISWWVVFAPIFIILGLVLAFVLLFLLITTFSLLFLGLVCVFFGDVK